MNQSDGITQNEVRKQYKMKYINYVGGIKTTTRPLCYHLVGKGPVWEWSQLEKELNKFVVNGVPLTSTVSGSKTANGKQQERGSGIIPGTSIDNFLVYRGGYRCGHEAIPARKPPKE